VDVRGDFGPRLGVERLVALEDEEVLEESFEREDDFRDAFNEGRGLWEDDFELGRDDVRM
jgi:hypothetical protein